MFNLKSLCVLTLSMSFTLSSAQNLYEQSFRNWDECPVKWSDFQVIHVPDDAKYVSSLSCSIEKTATKEKIGKFKFPSVTTTTKMSKLSSWYDPSRCTDWTLRDEQTRFNMLEVLRRRLQNSYNNNFMEDNLDAYYQQLINTTLSAFELESNYGTDTLVILKYEEQYNNELDSLQVMPVQIPLFEKSNWGMSFNVGLGTEIYGSPLSDGVPFTVGVPWGFGMIYKKLSLDIQFMLGWSDKLQCENFYYDSKYDYNWTKGKRVTGGNMNLNGGFRVFDNSKCSVTPMVGIGVTFVDQDSDTPRYPNGTVYENSEMNGFRVQAGLAFDWKIRQSLTGYLYGGDYNESKVRFAITGARTNFGGFGPAYSLNASIVFLAESWFLK